MPVAAGVGGDLGMAARRVLAARNMAAERRRTTALDRTHHLQLIEAHMSAVGLTPSRTVVAENVRDLLRQPTVTDEVSLQGKTRSRRRGTKATRLTVRPEGANYQ